MTTQPIQPTTPAVIATVSGNDLLARLDNVSTGLAKIEAKVDTIPAHIAALEQKAEANRAAIIELQRWRSFWTGVSSLAAFLLTGGIVTALITAFGHH